ncbi:PfkB family carbohydrate kinase [Paracoccus sp. (in: a-proteobacteria)]|uniref:PfkB family carbohydrate kinase n=1 Tax=Paracoccus sp. TaxID=267 RepID=UPI0026DFD9F4|nr:PfkB family carbohydrate kinase [Paracoccus sp. (in: a-proteobacteria)]MDO5646860.1 PfkB family carbohydrate kinase [Paracoccus sp. (in: a-proteobacteria)]
MTPDILCIGAMLWDIIGRSERRMKAGHDVPGRIRHIPGGVALNVAIAAARWGMRPAILSAVGRDPQGDALIAQSQELGVLTDFLARDTGLPTDSYMAVEDVNGLIAAIADAHSLEQAGDAILAPLSDALRDWSGPVVLDGNLTESLLAQIAQDPRLARADLRVIPASPGKAERLSPLIDARRGCFYLNRIEAEILAGHPCPDAATAAQAVLARGAARVLVTDGPFTVADAVAGEPILTETPPSVTVARVTGAGDCFLAAHLAAERDNLPRDAALRQAVQASAAHVSGKDVP